MDIKDVKKVTIAGCGTEGSQISEASVVCVTRG